MESNLLKTIRSAVRPCVGSSSWPRALAGLAVSVLLAGCQAPAVIQSQGDSGPNRIPAGVLSQPDPVPRDEPLSASGNAASYVVFGKRYERLPSALNFHATGIASWYGQKFHGRQTASGERYDMYSMTAAHKSLPLPTYVRVTNLANSRTVIVRVNDRGPFVDDRLIDLSYAAAAKLDMLDAGTARVRVVALSGVPGEPAGTASQAPVQQAIIKRPAASPADKPLPYRVPQPIISVGPGAEPAPPAQAAVRNQSKPLEPPVAPLLASADLKYLQIGAFGSFSSADDLRAAVTGTLAAPVFISKQPDSALFRVRIGPFANPAALANAAEQLRLMHQLAPIVVSGSEPKATCC